MKVTILRTKLQRPILSPDRIRRSRLYQRLDDGLATGRQVTLVSAPAGYGKTTCISDWIDKTKIPSAWLSLDSLDDDPGRFFIYLIAALQMIDPNLGTEIESVIHAGHKPSGEIISATIINDLLGLRQRFLLVLDDFHFIQDSDIFEVIERLINNQPQALHLVLITREDPPLSLARLRANNMLTEIRARDLRFSGQDIRTFFNAGMGLSLSEQDIAVLEQKTEGWAAGLQLAGLSIQDQSGVTRFITKLSGSSRFILSYLTEQVLDRLPDDVRQFLLQTSILDLLSADLCNAVTGRSDSSAYLERLYRENLFLIPLEDEHQWFRYHHLFADLLRGLSQGVESHQTASLHKRASQWFAETGMVNEAVQHALAAEDYPAAVDLLEEHATEMIMQGYARSVSHWMEALPDEWRSQSLKTNLAFAWAYLLQGAYPQASRHLDDLEGPVGAVDHSALKAEWCVMRSLILFMRGEIQACKDMADQALALAPETDDHIRSLAYYVQASVSQSNANTLQAETLYRKSIKHSRKAGSLFVDLMSTIGLVGAAVERGQLRQALETASQTISRLENSGELSPLSAFVFLSLGDVHYQLDQIEEAEKMAQRALRLCNLGGYNTGNLLCRLLFSRLYQARRTFERAALEVQKAADLLPAEAPEYLQRGVAAQQVRIYLDQDRLDAAVYVLQERGYDFDGSISLPEISANSPDWYSLARLHTSGLRTLLCQEPDPTELQTGLELADRIIAVAQRGQQVLVVLETLLIRSQIKALLGDPQGEADLIDALEQGQKEGIIRVFIEQGQPIAEAIAYLAKNNRLDTVDTGYVETIQRAFLGDPVEESAGGFSPDPLTDRERDVLRLMMGGLTYKEIADQLFVSLNTVRYHVKAIYRKLNVHNRTQAIEKARRQQIS